MSDPNRHHYIPQFYLHQWADANGQLVRYYRPHKAVVATRTTPKWTGYEDSLYSFEGTAPERRNAIEKDFMSPKVDDPASIAMQVLIAMDAAKLTDDLRIAWTRFVMSLHVRNPERVEQIKQAAAQGLRDSLRADPEEYEKRRSPDDPSSLLEWAELNTPAIFDNQGMRMLPGVIEHRPTVEAIIQMRWMTVGTAEAFPDLLTSDRPVYMSHGVNDERCFIVVPMSPKFMFFATRDPNMFDRVLSLGIESVTVQVNGFMATQAIQNVYGANDQHLQFVEDRLRPNPAQL
jgi:hypothetical protein